MQFDFFTDSENVVLRNDVILALEQHNAQAASQAWLVLTQRFPDADGRDSLRLLIDTLAARTPLPFADHRALQQARQHLQGPVAAAATGHLGRVGAAAWLRVRWQELAARAAPLAYSADFKEDHAAALWVAAKDWQAAIDAVAGIASWRRIPVPLSWMLLARLQSQGLQSHWGLLAELAWLAPQRLAWVLQQSTEPILQTLVRKFEASFDGSGDADDLAWFPAWVLTERPALAQALTQAQASQHTPPEQAMRVMLELLGLEHQGRQRELIERRKTLRGLHSALYAAYLATR